MAGKSAAQMRQEMGLLPVPGGVFPPYTFEIHPSTAYPGMSRIMSGTTTLADNQRPRQIPAFTAMTDVQQSIYVSHTHNAIRIATMPPQGSARFWHARR